MLNVRAVLFFNIYPSKVNATTRPVFFRPDYSVLSK